MSVWLAGALVLSACNARRAPDPPDMSASARDEIVEGGSTAAALVGTWDLQAVPPEARPGRMMLRMRIDSLDGTDVRGRLVHYFAGDVGVDSATFPHFEGEIRDDSVVRIAIRAAARPTSGFTMVGILRTDTIPLGTFVVGPDTVSGPTRSWRLVRMQR
jgi:hypothetical protein